MYRLIFEFANTNAFPRYFTPANSRLEFAATWSEALAHARAVVGKTRKATLTNDNNPSIVERRRNSQYIVTIMESGAC